ncbi:hypothetical protein BKA70DRAFT_1038873, partial [Coprinopsis sp. MPI-PUGE-AT-0042]
GLYGKCTAYFGTVEAQGRGSLHCHMLIWLEGHPSPTDLRSLLQSSEIYKDHLIPWIEFVMQGDYAGCESSSRQPSWSKKIEREIRGGSGSVHPGSIAGPTLDQYSRSRFWEEYQVHLNDLLLEYNMHEHKKTCFKNLKRGEKESDDNCRMGIDGTTRGATAFNYESGEITVKKTHPRINPYTGLVTFLLKCNTDVHFIGSGAEANSYMYYITDYITKPAMSMYVGLAALSYAIVRTENRVAEARARD